MDQIELELKCAGIEDVTALRLTLHEALSQPTRATLLLSTENELELEAALGKEAVVTVSVDGEQQRRWTLVVTGLQYESSTEHAHRYTLELQHELALLALRTDVRMFQKQSSKDIVAAVLEQAGVSAEHVKWQLDRALSPREYCVQHRETDFDFLARQLEREGIFYVTTEADTRFLEELCVKYALREVTHYVRVDGETEGHARGRDYENSFVCAPLDQPYRPQRQTPEPRVPGSENVVVTGPAGSEIHTDEYGRMTGKFFWDRIGKKDNTSSCWMRVLQHPIGGSMALARVGWEMDVRFLYGDPDRPVATYRIDNAAHTAPYAYPAAASAMSFKTLSSPGAGKHHEIAMEDGGGGMKFGFTASKDFNEHVNNNKTEKITVNEKLNVGINQSVTIDANQTVTIGAMLTKEVGGDAQVAIKGDRTKTVSAAEIVTVSGSSKETIIGSDSETVGASHITLAAMGISRTSKGSHSLTVGGAMISAAAEASPHMKRSSSRETS